MKIYRFSCLFLIPLILSLLLAACAPAATPAPLAAPAATAAPVKLTDGLKREVTLAAPAKRIVSLAPSNTEILFALGLSAQVVGVDDFSDYPPEAKKLPSVGGSMGKYNLEAITALKPDLVLAAEINTPEQVKAIQDLGLIVFYLSNPQTLEGMLTSLQIVARLGGVEGKANELAQSLQARIDAVKSKISAATQKPTVYYELDATDPGKPYTAGPGTFMDNLISLAGGQNIAADMTSPWGQISSEQIIARNPDIILLGDAAYGVTPESVGQRPGFSAINAVKNAQVLTFDDNLVSRPTARLVDGLETLAKLIHPDLFK
jgi:iron complex transport system substrate-binding protein